MEIAYSIEIHAPPEAVFSRVEAPEMAKEWMKGVGETKIIHETPERVGTTFTERMESDQGGLDMKGEITEFAPGRSIAFCLESRIHTVAVRYAVEPLLRGSRLSVNSTIRWKFPMNILSLFIGKTMKESILGDLREECAELKRLCETGFA